MKDRVQINFQQLAKDISRVENERASVEELMAGLPSGPATPVIGITGPPGAGKSTLVNALLSYYTKHHMRMAVLAVDPSSPFHSGSLLGDRIRMAAHFLNPDIFIRSLATRGALGGLSARAGEVIRLLRAYGFDRVIVETVGVGQSEIEIVRHADITTVVLVPESGDEIQSLKSGIMEIADILVVNKCDRPGSEELLTRLRKMFHKHSVPDVPVVGCIASEGKGVEELASVIEDRIIKLQSKPN